MSNVGDDRANYFASRRKQQRDRLNELRAARSARSSASGVANGGVSADGGVGMHQNHGHGQSHSHTHSHSQGGQGRHGFNQPRRIIGDPFAPRDTQRTVNANNEQVDRRGAGVQGGGRYQGGGGVGGHPMDETHSPQGMGGPGPMDPHGRANIGGAQMGNHMGSHSHSHGGGLHMNHQRGPELPSRGGNQWDNAPRRSFQQQTAPPRGRFDQTWSGPARASTQSMGSLVPQQSQGQNFEDYATVDELQQLQSLVHQVQGQMHNLQFQIDNLKHENQRLRDDNSQLLQRLEDVERLAEQSPQEHSQGRQEPQRLGRPPMRSSASLPQNRGYNTNLSSAQSCPSHRFSQSETERQGADGGFSKQSNGRFGAQGSGRAQPMAMDVDADAVGTSGGSQRPNFNFSQSQSRGPDRQRFGTFNEEGNQSSFGQRDSAGRQSRQAQESQQNGRAFGRANTGADEGQTNPMDKIQSSYRPEPMEQDDDEENRAPPPSTAEDLLKNLGDDAFVEDTGPRVECRQCGRKFNEAALAKHTKICSKVFQKKRKAFDVKKQRQDGDAAQAESHGDRSAKGGSKRGSRGGAGRGGGAVSAAAAKAKKASWKAESSSLREAIRAAREYNKAKAEGKDLSALPVRQSAVPDNRTPCPYCNRKFSAEAAERHIPKCKNVKSRPKATRNPRASIRRN